MNGFQSFSTTNNKVKNVLCIHELKIIADLVQKDTELDLPQNIETKNLHFFPGKNELRHYTISKLHKTKTSINKIRTLELWTALTTSEYRDISDLTSASAVSRKCFRTCRGGSSAS